MDIKPLDLSKNPQKMGTQEQDTATHLCDYCDGTFALLYCRADSAKLCISCDRQIHSANPIFSKHSRTHLCDSCGAQPASFLCSTHHLLLCSNCDFDAHPPSLDPHHHRRSPLEAFSGCPSASELASVFGLDEDKFLWAGDDAERFLDELVWDTPSVVCMEDLIVPMKSGWDFQAVGVPPPPKHRNEACGKHKEEIIRQLRDLFNSEGLLNSDHKELELAPRFQSLLPEEKHFPQNTHGALNVVHDSGYTGGPGSEENALQWQGGCCDKSDQVSLYYGNLLGSCDEETSLALDKPGLQVDEVHVKHDGEVPQHPVIRETTSLPTKGIHELLAPDRDSVILRYKEKKKTRRYDKQIRYESRKARADNRARVRGRFAKSNNDQSVRADLRQV